MDCVLDCIPGIVALAAIVAVVLLLFPVVAFLLVIIVFILIVAGRLLRSWHLQASFHGQYSTGTVPRVNILERVVIAVGKNLAQVVSALVVKKGIIFVHFIFRIIRIIRMKLISINTNLMLAMSNFILFCCPLLSLLLLTYE